jgi:hypothetical protein
MLEYDDDDATDYDDDDDTPEWNSDFFAIPIDYASLFDLLSFGADHLLRRPNLTPREIAGIALLKFVTNRLPLITRGCELSLNVYSEDSQGGRIGYYLEISEWGIEIGRADYEGGPCGGDSQIDTIFRAEPGGYYDDGGIPAMCYVKLESWTHYWLELCESPEWKLDFKYQPELLDWDNQTDYPDPWSEMPSCYD